MNISQPHPSSLFLNHALGLKTLAEFSGKTGCRATLHTCDHDEAAKVNSPEMVRQESDGFRLGLKTSGKNFRDCRFKPLIIYK